MKAPKFEIAKRPRITKEYKFREKMLLLTIQYLKKRIDEAPAMSRQIAEYIETLGVTCGKLNALYAEIRAANTKKKIT